MSSHFLRSLKPSKGLKGVSLFFQFQEKGPEAQTRGRTYSSSLHTHSIYFLLICAGIEMSTVISSLRIFLPACNEVYDLLKIF